MRLFTRNGTRKRERVECVERVYYRRWMQASGGRSLREYGSVFPGRRKFVGTARDFRDTYPLSSLPRLFSYLASFRVSPAFFHPSVRTAHLAHVMRLVIITRCRKRTGNARIEDANRVRIDSETEIQYLRHCAVAQC